MWQIAYFSAVRIYCTVYTVLWSGHLFFFFTATLLLLLPSFNGKLQIEGKGNIDDFWSDVWSPLLAVRLLVYFYNTLHFCILLNDDECSLCTYALQILTVQKHAVLDTSHVHVVSISLIKFGLSCFSTELIQLLCYNSVTNLCKVWVCPCM